MKTNMDFLLVIVVLLSVTSSVVHSATVNSNVSRNKREHHHGHHTSSCTGITEYNNIINKLTTQDRCLTVNSVWSDLWGFAQRNHHCYQAVLSHMQVQFGHVDALVPAECQCRPTHHLGDHNIPRLPDGHIRDCRRDSSYMDLERKLFDHHHKYGCSAHQFVWKELTHIHTMHGIDCVDDFVRRASINTIHPCQCGPVAARVTTTTTTATTPATPPPTTTTTTTTPATHRPFDVHTSCNKLSTVGDIAELTPVDHVNSTSCAGRTSGSNEAFTLVHCDVPHFTHWRKGPNVQEMCAYIPTFTPVATFPPSSDVYTPSGSESGVFLGCIPNGFKLAVQHCNGSPTIEHVVHGGVFTTDPHVYFVIG